MSRGGRFTSCNLINISPLASLRHLHLHLVSIVKRHRSGEKTYTLRHTLSLYASYPRIDQYNTCIGIAALSRDSITTPTCWRLRQPPSETSHDSKSLLITECRRHHPTSPAPSHNGPGFAHSGAQISITNRDEGCCANNTLGRPQQESTGDQFHPTDRGRGGRHRGVRADIWAGVSLYCSLWVCRMAGISEKEKRSKTRRRRKEAGRAREEDEF